jgi:hypothetical protein
MKQNSTRIHCVLDRSGSMKPIIESSIEGINKFINDQKEIKDQECNLSIDIFDTTIDCIREKCDIQTVTDITTNDYVPRGMTALYDAIGFGINKLGNELSSMPEEDRPERIFFVILTDGEENASKEYNFEKISEMIKHQTEVYSWNFIFLAANQDAFSVGSRLNIKTNAQFYGTANSTRSAYGATSTMIKSLRIMSKESYDGVTKSDNNLYDATNTSKDYKDN